MTEKVEIVTTGWPGLREVATEANRALISRVSQRGGTLTRELVAQYFSTRSETNTGYIDIVAAASATYGLLIAKAISYLGERIRDRELRVLDYGCGRGHLLSQLRHHGFDGIYLGYDVDAPGIRQLQISAPDRVAFTSKAPTDRFDVVFAVNVLPYVSDDELQGTLRELAASVADRGKLVVADPWPSWRWETKFDGLALRLRRIESIERHMNRLGLHVRVRLLAAPASVRGLPLLPFAHLEIQEKVP